MTQSAVARFEAGGTVPSLPVLDRLARALGADLVVHLTPRANSSADKLYYDTLCCLSCLSPQLACLRGVAVLVERADFQVLVLPVGEQGGQCFEGGDPGVGC